MGESIYRIDFGDAPTLSPNVMWINRPGPGVLRGPRRHPLGLFEHLGAGTGFPPNLERPIFVLDVSNGSAPRDVEIGAEFGRWLVSRRVKDTFDRLDPEAFVFLQSTTRIRDRKGEYEGPDYFLYDVVRFVDALDESKSDVRVTKEPHRHVRLFGEDNVFRRLAIGTNKVFRLMYAPSTVICTEAVRTAWRQAGLLDDNIEFRRLGVTDG